MFNQGSLHLVLNNDRFAEAQPVVVQPDLSQVSFQIESENSAAHNVTLDFTAATAGTYSVTDAAGVVATMPLQAGQPATVSLPMAAGASPQTFGVALKD